MKNTYAISVLLVVVVIIVWFIYGFVPTPNAFLSVTSTTTPVVTLPPADTGKPPVKNQNSIAIGEKKTFGDIAIIPTSIMEDSRCPVNVQCIWAGRVKVEVIATTAKTSQVLIVSSDAPVTYEGHIISLLNVTPVPKSGNKPSPADYRFEFSVEKSSGATPPVITGSKGACYVGGCSSEVCSDAPNAVSNCLYNGSYACYKTATCERQINGECGWTDTPELQSCIKSKS